MHVRRSLHRFFTSLRRKTKEGGNEDVVVTSGGEQWTRNLHSGGSTTSHINDDGNGNDANSHVGYDGDDDDDCGANSKVGYRKWMPTKQDTKSYLKLRREQEIERNLMLLQLNQDVNNVASASSTTSSSSSSSASSSSGRFTTLQQKKEQSLSRCQLLEEEVGVENDAGFDFEFGGGYQTNSNKDPVFPASLPPSHAYTNFPPTSSPFPSSSFEENPESWQQQNQGENPVRDFYNKQSARRKNKKLDKIMRKNVISVKVDVYSRSQPKLSEDPIEQKCYDNADFSIESEAEGEVVQVEEATKAPRTLVSTSTASNEGKSARALRQQQLRRKNNVPREKQSALLNNISSSKNQKKQFFENEMDAIVASSTPTCSFCSTAIQGNNSTKRLNHETNSATLDQNPPGITSKAVEVVGLSKKKIFLLGVQKGAKTMKKALRDGFIAWGESISYASAVMPQLYAADCPPTACHNNHDYYCYYATDYKQNPPLCSHHKHHHQHPRHEQKQGKEQHQLHQSPRHLHNIHTSLANNYALQCTSHGSHHSQLAY